MPSSSWHVPERSKRDQTLNLNISLSFASVIRKQRIEYIGATYHVIVHGIYNCGVCLGLIE